jgi:hypothetical protein
MHERLLMLKIPVCICTFYFNLFAFTDVQCPYAAPCTLQPGERSFVDLSVIANTVGLHLHIIGWTFALTITTIDNRQVQISGRQTLNVRGQRLNRTKHERQSSVYAEDYRLRFRVVNKDALPLIRVQCLCYILSITHFILVILVPQLNTASETGMLSAFCGQLCTIQLSVTNMSSQASLQSASVCAQPCQSIAILQNNGSAICCSVDSGDVAKQTVCCFDIYLNCFFDTTG